MPNINDRIGSQNVIRVLSNASAPPTRIVNLNDIDTALKTKDGVLLVWNLSDEKFYMTDTIDSSSLIATGIVTFSNTTQSTSTTTGGVIFSGGVGIAKDLNVGGNAKVVGVVTFGTGTIVVNGDSNIITVGTGVTISSSEGITAPSLNILGPLTAQSLNISGVSTLASAGGITTTGGNLFVNNDLTVGQNLKVDGTSEFIGIVTFRGGTINLGDAVSDDINIGGEFISDLNPSDDASYDLGITTQRWRNARFSGLVTTTDLFVSGVSTFIGDTNIDGNVDVDGNLVIDDLLVSGISTFSSDIDINASIDVDGLSELDELNVSGLSTFASDVDVNASVDISSNLIVDGLSDLDELNVAGLSTFASNLDINASVDISSNLVVNGNLQTVGVTTLASSGGITTTGGNLFVNNDLTVGQNLKVDGTSEFIGIVTFRGGTINLGDQDTDDINIGGEFVSDLNPSDDASYDLGIVGKRWKDARFSGLITSTNLYVSGISTFEGNQFTTGNVSITGFATVTDGLFYEVGDFDGPNGVAYFDDTGKLIGAASTESGISTSNYVLTTNASGIPVWTDTIDGGQF
jgi:hypothetical protein